MTVESTVSPAEDDDDGRAEAAVTTCALLLDQEGKILSVTFDCVEAAASYNTSGNVTWPGTYKSKKELGYDYGLKKYSSIRKKTENKRFLLLRSLPPPAPFLVISLLMP